MTNRNQDERRVLEACAKACGVEILGWYDNSLPLTGDPAQGMKYARIWNPITDDGDCARMCAALGIDTLWSEDGLSVICEKLKTIDSPNHCAYFSDYNDRLAAWRFAACQVGAAIGEKL